MEVEEVVVDMVVEEVLDTEIAPGLMMEETEAMVEVVTAMVVADTEEVDKDMEIEMVDMEATKAMEVAVVDTKYEASHHTKRLIT